MMRQEEREQAEILLSIIAERIKTRWGLTPTVFIREGKRAKELLKLIDEEHNISVLVLATSTRSDDPGPLVTQLTGKNAGRLRVPITIVPGSLSQEEIEAVT
jgi:nucleotide-binding universal stress UspA family protein